MNELSRRLGLVVMCWLVVTRAAIFEKSGRHSDYAIIAWVNARAYDHTLPGVAPKTTSQQKWYINCALFEPEGVLAKVISFPASLLSTPEHFAAAEPQLIQFISRKGTVGRELITIEDGMVVKYAVGIEKDSQTNQPLLAADFGKRLPITFAAIDTTYTPRADEHGDIYFKTKAGIKKWDSTTQRISDGVTKLAAPTPGRVHEFQGTFTVNDAGTQYAIESTATGETIDPLNASHALTQSNDQQQSVAAALKLQAREGTPGRFNKRFNNAEVDAIVSALTPSGGGIIAGDTMQAIIQDESIVLPLNYYRFLRAYVRRPKNTDWQDFRKFRSLRDAVLAYPGKMLDEAKITALIKHIMDGITIIDWAAWFKSNTVVMYDLLFDHLITVNEHDLDMLFNVSHLNLSQIMAFKQAINTYKIHRP